MRGENGEALATAELRLDLTSDVDQNSVGGLQRVCPKDPFVFRAEAQLIPFRRRWDIGSRQNLLKTLAGMPRRIEGEYRDGAIPMRMVLCPLSHGRLKVVLFATSHGVGESTHECQASSRWTSVLVWPRLDGSSRNLLT